MRSLFIASSCILLVAIAGCGSDAGSTAPPVSNDPPPVSNDPPPPAPVQGVATPSSVAVVTATNAQ